MHPPPDIPSFPCRGLPPGTPCPWPEDCFCNRDTLAHGRYYTQMVICGLALGIAVACVAIFWFATLAHGADNLAPCYTRAQAKERWPKAWLYWHTEHHCWDNVPGRRHRYAPRPPAEKTLAAIRWYPREFEQARPILFPEFLIPHDDDECCWPPLPAFAPWEERVRMTGVGQQPELIAVDRQGTNSER